MPLRWPQEIQNDELSADLLGPVSAAENAFLRNKPISLVNTAADTAPGRPSLILHRGCRAFDAVGTVIREGIEPPPAASRSLTLLSGRETVLEGPILGLPGLIEEKPAEQAGSCASGGTEPRVPADGPGDGADAGARSGTGNRALLGRGHVGTSSDRQSDGREQQ